MTVRNTIAVDIAVCQSMLESDDFTDLKNSERCDVSESSHENKLPKCPFP